MEMSMNKLHDLLLVNLMKILEFVDYSLNIQSVGGNYIWLSFDQMLCFLRRDVTVQIMINMMMVIKFRTYLTVVKV